MNKTKIAFIHTSPAAIGPLMQFYGEAAPDLEITNLLDDGLLRLYLESLAPELSYAFDLRHPTWQAEEVDEALAGAGAAHVGALEGTVPFRYLRLRETPYDDRSLAAWADRLRPLLASGVEVFVYFKHEDQPTAPLYAEQLRELVAARARS